MPGSDGDVLGDWLLDDLRSRIDLGRADIAEEALMRLSRDALLLHEHLTQNSDTDAAPPRPVRHQLSLEPASSCDSSPVRRTAQEKLSSFVTACECTGCSEVPETFLATAEDMEHALDHTEPPLVASLPPQALTTWPRLLFMAGAIVLLLSVVVVILV